MEALWKAIEEEPDDPLHKMALADYFDEMGENPLAVAGLRWCAENRRSPRDVPHDNDLHWLWRGTELSDIPLRSVLDIHDYHQMFTVCTSLYGTPGYTWSLQDAFVRIGMWLKWKEEG